MSDIQFMNAVRNGELDAVNNLIDSGIDVNRQDEQGWTALCIAAAKGDVNMIRLLVERGCDMFKTGRDNRTPYMIALAAGHAEAAKLLTEAGKRAGADMSPSRLYCRAYLLDDLRRFPGWTDSVKTSESGEVEGQTIVYIHEDLTVTESARRSERVIRDEITQEWERFCKDVLKFQAPDDLDLIVPSNRS